MMTRRFQRELEDSHRAMMNGEEPPLALPKTTTITTITTTPPSSTVATNISRSNQIAFPETAIQRSVEIQADQGTKTPPTRSNLSALLESQDTKSSEQLDNNKLVVESDTKLKTKKNVDEKRPESATTTITTTRRDCPPLHQRHQQQPPVGLSRLGRSVPSRDSPRRSFQPHLESFRSLQKSRIRSLSISDKGGTTPTSLRNVTSPRERSHVSVRRSISSQHLGAMVRTSQGPFTHLLRQRDVVQDRLRKRLLDLKNSSRRDRSFASSESSDGSSSNNNNNNSSRSSSNEQNKSKERKLRRAQQTNAVVSDLCEIVADLFVAESKLLNPSSYGIEPSFERSEVVANVHSFVSDLPSRYALSVETPSEVLLHMRLMAAAKSNHSRAVVHINNLQTGEDFHQQTKHQVTIACFDVEGLLEYITKILGTGGARVLDADVMLSKDGIVLDRFVVRMTGRLRLDKLAKMIESFLATNRGDEEQKHKQQHQHERPQDDKETANNEVLTFEPESSGQLYYHPPTPPGQKTSTAGIEEEIQSAVPLSHVLASSTNANPDSLGAFASELSLPSTTNPPPASAIQSEDRQQEGEPTSDKGQKKRRETRRPLVNREATIFNDIELPAPTTQMVATAPRLAHPDSTELESRIIPIIPFEELMLIEALSTGRVTTVYKALWRRDSGHDIGAEGLAANGLMVALKVAMASPDSRDTSHIDEVRREADIAAMLEHPNICDIAGIAADADCFCLAYEFCGGGSLLSLLSDTTRFYEYLPIALDIANGMAYLHSRNVIHRDLKPSNVLLTSEHRAKIADFGMSVANLGQELTAETGTYRYMAPEVIRHESYSSNADVYSFGIVLWQLVTREIPFATKTPIQAAFAVAEGERPPIPSSTPPRIREIIRACWNQDSHKRPSFVYVAMELADYARMMFSPANVGARTLEIANEMLASVHGNSTVNVDFSTPVTSGYLRNNTSYNSLGSSANNIGLEI